MITLHERNGLYMIAWHTQPVYTIVYMKLLHYIHVFRIVSKLSIQWIIDCINNDDDDDDDDDDNLTVIRIVHTLVHSMYTLVHSM